MASQYSALASNLRVAHRFLESRGRDAHAWFTEQGVDPGLAMDPRARIDSDIGERMLLKLIEEYPGENLGALLAEHARITDNHLLGVLLYASEDGVAAFKRLARYQVFMNTAEPFVFSDDGEFMTIERRVLLSPPAAALAQSYYFTCILNDLRQIGITQAFEPMVSFTTPPQGSRASYKKIFGEDIHFEQPTAFLRIPSAVLRTPLTTANPDIISINENMFAALVRSIRSSGLKPNLRMRILDKLPEEVLTEESAANALNMSTRTLQRKLAAEGTSFKALQQESRRQLASMMLSDPSLSVTEVAFSCGFSDPGSFSRAFKRWTDSTPSEFRANLSD